MSAGKVLLINQSPSEVSAFEAEGIPFVAVYINNCPESAKVAPVVGLRSFFVDEVRDLIGLAAVRECTFIASYRDGSATLCSQAQSILGMDSNCGDDYFRFFHDKLSMNEVLVSHGLTRSFGALIEGESTLFPGPGRYIFKPRSLQGSLGVKAVTIANESAWRSEVSTYLADLASITYEEGFLWEGFASGQEYSADVYMHSGVLHLLGFARKGTAFQGNFVESSHVVGEVLPPQSSKVILDMLETTLARVGYMTGPAHVEFKLDAKGVHFIEFHPRPGGDNLIDLIWMATGASLVEHLRAHLAGRTPGIQPSAGRYSAIQYFKENPTPELVARLEMLPELKVKSQLAPNGEIRSSRDRPAYVLCRGVALARLATIMSQTLRDVGWDQFDFVTHLLEGQEPW